MALYFIAGLPAAGKKSLFKAAREKVKDSPNYAFFLPIVTKDTDMVDTEEHQKLVSEEEYNDAKGAYLLAWKNGACNCALSQDIVSAVESGKKVVAYASTEQLSALQEKLQSVPQIKFTVVSVTASMDNLVARAKEVEEKLNDKNFVKKVKKIESELPKIEPNARVENDRSLEAGLESFLHAIGFDPLLDIPPKSEEEKAAMELKTCSPQEYLKRVVYPHLYPALERIDRERPEDPVELLALYLYKSASVHRKRVGELNELKSVKTQLRDTIKQEYEVKGRI